MTHVKAYSFNAGARHAVVAGHLRNQLEELFDEFKVDLVLSGHVHAYARTCNVYNDRCVDPATGGMMHITLGMRPCDACMMQGNAGSVAQPPGHALPFTACQRYCLLS